MQQVCCRDCGASLGWQAEGTEIDWRNWKHNRCPLGIRSVSKTMG